MKTLLPSGLILATLCFAQSAPPTPETTPQPGRGGRGATAMDERSNEQNGVDIDRFIGNPVNTPVHLSHGTLLTHAILRAGDPYTPGLQGAVLEYRKELSTATLLGMNRTPLATLPDEFFFIVQSGEGRLDDGKQAWPLRPGIAVLAPPNVPHRLTNTTEKPLEMILLSWAAAGTPKDELIVRDVNLLNYCEENAHWNNTSKCIFGAADGLFASERMYVVMLQPWAASAPHSHGAGTEEIWVKLTPGTATMWMGSELREMPQDSAYLVPPTGFTKHANLNLSKDKVEWWLYVARGPKPPENASGNPPGGGRGGRGGGRGPANPNLSREVTQATLKGSPLN